MIAAMLSISLPGKPLGFARAGRNGKASYTPGAQKAFMEHLGFCARREMTRAGYAPFEGALKVTYRATFVPPASWSQKLRESARWKTSAIDIDNHVKLALDALNKIAWRDDAQVSWLEAQKVYGPTAGVVITIESLSDRVEA